LKFATISASLVPTRQRALHGSAFGLRRIVLALFILVVLSGLAAAQAATCPFNSPGGNITHIVYIHFDNVHLERDNPNVPSDLEQMPNLYNFITSNGTLLSNHHTTLISHTADNILTTETGVYGDRHGQAVANGFVAANPSSNKFWDEFPSSFTYWTDPVETSSTEDTAFSMITAQGQNAPAPWVPFTRMGCNVGAVSIANLEMENTNGDIANVYGRTSPQFKESTTQAAVDFEGIAIHCAAGNPLCTSSNSTSCSQAVSGGIMGYNGACAEPDLLPSEPNGYNGYMGLFGHVYVAPAICPTCAVNNGRPTVNDLNGNAMNGFPGFSNISAAQTLGYVAQMLENGVPVVFSYISDLHDCHSALSTCTLTDGFLRALGPGEAPYETQIQAYNQAFGEFFTRLQNDGIDSSNTLFIITADEQDHFAGGPASPAGCDGVNTPCNYVYPEGYTPTGNDSPPGLNLSVGEVQGDLTQLYQQQFPSLVPPSTSDSKGPNSGLTASGVYDWHYDMAPAVSLNPYLASNTPAFARQLERATTQLTAPNPITGNTDHLTNYIVDNAGLSALHMITGDPLRTPTFVMFANPDWYFQEQTEGIPVEQEQDYAYNHGGVAPEINATWLGLVGPGVANNGVDSTTWSDHVDTRATLLYLTGLTDDYQGDGRVLVEDLVQNILPASIQSNLQSFEQLAAAYKQMNAPIGAFGQAALQGSTVALASGSTGSDTKYIAYENSLTQLTSQRNTLATQIKAQLYGLEYQGAAWNPTTVSSETSQAHSLTVQAQVVAASQNGSTASFGQVNVGTAAPVQTLTYTFGSPTTLTAVSILTDGQPNLDYVDGGSSTCATATPYLSGQSCTVTVAFTPSAPGLRSGAVALFQQGTNVPLAAWYLNGQGQSSAVTIDPGTQTSLSTLANNGQASGTAVDGAGNVYVVDNANSAVFELAAKTFTATPVVPSGSGLSNPTAVALDAAGNLYVSDTGNNRVALVPNEQGTLNSADISTVNISGLGTPAGLAVDGNGNLYVADSANGNVIEVPTGGGSQVTVASSLTNPRAVAVDAAGNVYVSANNQVTEYPAGGGSTVPYGSGFSNPSGLAVDASGAVYVADSGNSRIVRVAPGGASQANLPVTGVSNPQGVALDSSANVYATSAASVYEVNRTQAALAFATISAGSTSAPQTVTVSNAGNQTLDVSSVAASANFTVVPSGGTDCTSSTQLASALQCLMAVEFAPQVSGALTGTLTLSDNALNNSASTQAVQLSGSATAISQTINFPSIPTQTYGGPAVTLNATATSGLTVSYSVTNGSATVNGNILTITGAGSVTVQASQSGNGEYAAATPVSQTFTVNQATQSISVTTAAPATAVYGATFTVVASASSSLPITFTSSGACSNSGATYTITAGAGTCSVKLSQPGNTNYTAATSVSEKTTAQEATQTVSFTGAPATAVYGTSFTVTATSNAPVTPILSTNAPCHVTGTTVYIDAASGTCIMTATWNGNGNYKLTTATQSTTLGVATPVLTWATPASITYGTALSATQLNATASTGGTFRYNPVSGKILAAGTQALSVTFTPALRTDYATVTGGVNLQVLPASSTTTIISQDQTVMQNGTGVATATVQYNVASYKPTGDVTLTASTGEACSGAVAMATGNGSCKLYFVTTGTRTITATYSGDDNHTGSNSSSQTPAVTVTVNP
jgi:sugar lactone lactonase YvrE